MPDVAANAFPIIFGDPKGYYLVRRIGFSVQVLNEIVATSNKVRVLGRLRIGGQVGEDWRLKIQKVST
jgi:HK97 family phage major capsid protein